jgi:uncharacterized protein YjdB
MTFWYKARMATAGWTGWQENGKVIGSEGSGQFMEAIEFQYRGPGKVFVRGHVQNIGLMKWVGQQELCGSENRNLRLEAVEFKMEGNPILKMIAKAKVDKKGWLPPVTWGNTLGSVGQGLGLEAIQMTIEFPATPVTGPIMRYKAHISSIGWMDWQPNGKPVGTDGENRGMEAVLFEYRGPGRLMARAHCSCVGWLNWVKPGQVCGTIGQNRHLEAIQLRVDGAPPPRMFARAKVQDHPWSKPVSWEKTIGTVGQGLYMESLEVAIETNPGEARDVKEEAPLLMRYRACVNGRGWMDFQDSGDIVGSIGDGREIEALEFQYSGPGNLSIQICYRNEGWQEWAPAGVVGAAGQGKRIKAIRMKLENGPEPKLRAQAYVMGRGWLPNVSWNQIIGTTSDSLQIEALCVALDAEKAPARVSVLQYRACLADIGWMDWRDNGSAIGAIGHGLMLEGVEFQYNGPGTLMVRAHVDGDGWGEWQKAGVCGAPGKGKRLNAIEFQIKGAECELRARPYMSGRGWLPYVGWNETVGWAGHSLQMEAIEVNIGKKSK